MASEKGLERDALKMEARASGGNKMLKRRKGFKDGTHGGKEKDALGWVACSTTEMA